VIITDLIMPEMDGLEFTRRLRQMPNFKETIIIANSASVFEEDQKRSRLAGCDAFLPKPVQIDQLQAILQQFISLDEAEPTETEPLDKQPLLGPPAAELAVLLELARMGDIRTLQEQIDQLAQQTADYQPLAAELRRLARSFQIDAILRLLRSFSD
jgi:DNA-binding response OmpR family regulator